MLLLIFALIFQISCMDTVLGGVLPDFSHDHYEEDILHVDWAGYDISAQLREENEYKPNHCRTDMCRAEEERHLHTGSLTWPETRVDTRVFVRCPYSVFEPTYAHRVCELETDSWNTTSDITAHIGSYNNSWAVSNMSACPGPPLKQILDKWKRLSKSDLSMAVYHQIVSECNNVTKEYTDQPVSSSDIKQMVIFIYQAIEFAVRQEQRYSVERIQDAFELIDYILDYDERLKNYFFNGRPESLRIRFVDAIVLLSEMYSPDGISSYLLGDHLSMAAVHVTEPEQVVSLENNQNVNHTYPMTFKFEPEGNYKVHIVYFENEPILPEAYLEITSSYGENVIQESEMDQSVGRRPPRALASMTEEGMMRRDFLGDSLKKRVKRQGITPSVIFPSMESIIDRPNNTGIETSSIGETITKSKIKPLGSVAHVTVRHHKAGSRNHFVPSWKENDVHVSVTFTAISPIDIQATDEARCGSNSYVIGDPDLSGYKRLGWSRMSCSAASVIDSRTIRCKCVARGYLAVFSTTQADHEDTDLGSVMPGNSERESNQGSTFSEFLGFPYHIEVYITSHVLRALSLCCLVVTVLSYVIHKKARKGTPTRILLHLCCTLILLQVTMYVTEVIGGSRWGCRVSNILRYYLVMVSLIWNAVEAVNMYIMLVRVFNSEISRFVTKAAAVAWGIPLIGIICVLAVTRRGFDGTHDDHCVFTCQLQKNVLFYAYLLPMGIILLHNIIIFGLVLKVLINHGKARPADKRSSNWIRLVGAISMMVLLGVPWLFSAFGAIDATDGEGELAMVEGIFQVVFIVLMNLQGVFIFLFHCARNEQMRKQWRDSFTSSASSKYMMSSLKTSSVNSTQNSDILSNSNITNLSKIEDPKNR